MACPAPMRHRAPRRFDLRHAFFPAHRGASLRTAPSGQGGSAAERVGASVAAGRGESGRWLKHGCTDRPGTGTGVGTGRAPELLPCAGAASLLRAPRSAWSAPVSHRLGRQARTGSRVRAVTSVLSAWLTLDASDADVLRRQKHGGAHGPTPDQRRRCMCVPTGACIPVRRS